MRRRRRERLEIHTCTNSSAQSTTELTTLAGGRKKNRKNKNHIIIMNALVATTIELNNKGVELVEAGKVEAALQMFNAALRSSRSLLDSMAPALLSSNGNFRGEFSGAQRCSFTGTKQGLFSVPCHLYWCDDDQAAATFVCSNICRIPEQGFTDQCVAFYSIICLFNLAVTSHLRALLSTDGATTTNKGGLQAGGYSLLTATKRLYELTHQLLMRNEGSISVMFNLAIVNNLGQVYKRMGETKKSRQCFEHLLSTLMFVKESFGAQGVEDEDEEQQLCKACLEGFHSNIVSELILDGNGTAPAA
jgi:tetratricopeptide (TPR) repeat protein